MGEENNRLQGTWIITDYHKYNGKKIKSDGMKFGEEQLKLILQNYDDPNSHVSISMKIENFKSQNLRFKAKFEFVNKDTEKIVEKTQEFGINNPLEYPTIQFPMYGLGFEDSWVYDDKVTIKYDILRLTDNSYANIYNNIVEILDADKVKEDYDWEISDFDRVAKKVESQVYQIRGGLAFKLRINRPDDYTTTDAKFTIEVECVTIKDKNIEYNFQIELVNYDPTRSETKTKSYKFEKEEDSFLLVFNTPYSDITEDNGFLFMCGASIKVVCSNYEFLLTDDVIDNLNNFVNYAIKENSIGADDTSLGYSDLTDISKDNDKHSMIYGNYNYTTTTSLDSSKQSTGYVGLRNQGATCYMNSMLQSLFHIPAFRRLVYQMPTTGFEDVAKSIPLCLQRLFVYMQFSDKACSTKALTKSFGWDDYQTIVQHDVQEFSRVLLDNLEEKMKNTNLDGEIAKLFRGKYRSFVRCIDVPFESSKIEYFYDLQLVVKDTKDLTSSFAKYVETEKLYGDNQYSTDQYGKQDAVMGTEFVEFPSILHLHLRRFEYDFNYDQMTKINSRFEFPQTIDLSEYLAKDADRTKSNVFDLYGVLVHSGTIYGGHYYAFLRTTTGTQWYQFNDSHVSLATAQQSIDENFGGSSTAQSTPYTYGGYTGYSITRGSYNYSYEKSYSAYMLVYVRRSDAERIFTPVSDDEIPDHLKKYFKDHPDDDESTSTTSYYNSNELTIKVVPEDGIVVNEILHRPGFECKELIKTFSFVRSKDNDKILYEKVADAFGLKVEQIRLWTAYYQFTPYSVISNKDTSLTYSTSFFLQKKPEDEDLENSKKIVILLKFFDLTLPVPIQYLGSILIDKSESVESLFPKVLQILGLPEALSDQLLVFQEGSDYARAYDKTLTFESEYSSIQSLIFQFEQKFEEEDIRERDALLKSSSFHFYSKEDLPRFLENSSEETKEGEKTEESTEDKEKEKKEKEKEKENEENEFEKYKDLPLITYSELIGIQKAKDVNQYLQSLKDPVNALAYDYNDVSKPIARVQFSPSLYLDELKSFIAKAFSLNYTPGTDLLLIYKKSFYENEPSAEPIKSETLSNEFYSYYNSKAHRIYCRLIPNMTKEKMDTMTTIDVSVCEDGYNVSLKRKLLVEKESPLENIKNKIFELINKNPSDFDQNKYRLSKIYDHKYEKIFTDLSETLQTFDTNIRLDFINEDQLELIEKEKSKQTNSESLTTDETTTTSTEDATTTAPAATDDDDGRILVQGSHLTTEYSRAKNCDDPFFFILNKNESYEDFFNRVKETFNLGDLMKRCKLLISGDYPTISSTTQFMKPDKTVGQYIESLNLTGDPRLYIFHPPHQNSSRNETIKITN